MFTEETILVSLVSIVNPGNNFVNRDLIPQNENPFTWTAKGF
jgi:hypothetical protein